MKYIITVFIFLSGVIHIHAQSIEGLWDTEKENTIIKIKKVENLYEGAIYSSDNSKAKISKIIAKDIEKKQDSYKGKIYVDKKKKWFDAEFIRTGNKLYITVYAGFSTKTVAWQLVN